MLQNSLLLIGQEKTTLSGFVYDKSSGDILIGATIHENQTKSTVVSNEYGFYSLTVLSNSDSLDISVSYIGHIQQFAKVAITNKEQLDFYLISGIDLDAVVINAMSQNIVKSNETGTIHLKMKEVNLMPNLFGEVDIIKAFHLTPGVQSGGEAKSNLYVRGGSPDQNLILLDDVPLYYVAHFGGFFSVFNSDIINDVKLIKGGFPARYGGRLSSVVDVRMKEGNMNKLLVKGSLGLLSSKISIEAPIIKNKMSFIVSARKDVVPIYSLLGTGLSYSFYDVNAKLKYNMSNKNKFFLSFYNGSDLIAEKSEIESIQYNNSIKWGNNLVAFRWNHVYNNNLFSNLTLSNTIYNYKNYFELNMLIDSFSRQTTNSMVTGINDYNLKFDLTYLINPKIKFRFGYNSIYHTFIPNDENFSQIENDTTINRTFSSSTNALENILYLENEIRLNKITANIGIRYTHYFVENSAYSNFEPRFLVNYIINDNFSVKYSFTKMQQYIHLLSFSGTGVPSDYWMPSTENVIPEKSIQNSIQIAKIFSDNKYEIDVEIYHKLVTNLITFKEGISLMGNFENWENLVETKGKGFYYGIEFSVRKVIGKTTGWVAFAVSKAEKQFENINNGQKYPYKYNRLFNVNTVFIHKINKNIDFSATWSYGSGYPITLVDEHYSINENEIFVYGSKNSFRMRDYHRLDIAFNFFKKTNWGERTWTISVFNLYNRQNPYYYYYNRELIGARRVETEHGVRLVPVYDELKLFQRSLFPFFPSFSYRFAF